HDEVAGRAVVELLADLLADAGPRPAATGAGLVRLGQVVLDPLARQVVRQRLPTVAGPGTRLASPPAGARDPPHPGPAAAPDAAAGCAPSAGRSAAAAPGRGGAVAARSPGAAGGPRPAAPAPAAGAPARRRATAGRGWSAGLPRRSVGHARGRGQAGAGRW